MVTLRVSQFTSFHKWGVFGMEKLASETNEQYTFLSTSFRVH